MFRLRTIQSESSSSFLSLFAVIINFVLLCLFSNRFCNRTPTTTEFRSHEACRQALLVLWCTRCAPFSNRGIARALDGELQCEKELYKLTGKNCRTSNVTLSTRTPRPASTQSTWDTVVCRWIKCARTHLDACGSPGGLIGFGESV